MKETLYIAAKAPRAGLCKTRLGHAIGHERAAALYRAFLIDLSVRFASAPFTLGWYVTPADAWAEISPLAASGDEARVMVQGSGDWAQRQRQLFREAAARGEDRIVLIASDSPHVIVQTIAEAFRKLDEHDLILGATFDGGYYLVGMRADTVRYDVLGVPMSTSSVLADVAARADNAGLSVGWVDETFDVDEVEDLAYLKQLVARRADMKATRAALEGLQPHQGRRDAMIEGPTTEPDARGQAAGRDPTARREVSR